MNGVTGKVIIYGQGFNNIINTSFLDNSVEISVGDGNNILIGGRGSSNIFAGNGNNVVIGGLLSTGGPEQIQVGNGSNIIIAGPGGGSVDTGSGGNFIIGGSLSQTGWDDTFYQTLQTTLATWSSSTSFQSRVSSLLPEVNTSNYSSTQNALSINLTLGGSNLVVIDPAHATVSGSGASDQISSFVNPVPQVDFTGPTTALVGQPVIFTLNAMSPSDPSPSAVFTFQIIVADKNSQSVQTFTGTSGSTFSLLFNDFGDGDGSFGIVVFATDENGNTSVAAIRGIVVLPNILT